jgi:hypothetical protein
MRRVFVDLKQTRGAENVLRSRSDHVQHPIGVVGVYSWLIFGDLPTTYYALDDSKDTGPPSHILC